MTSTVRLPPPKPCRSIGSCSSADGGKPHQTMFATGTITDLTTDDTLLVFRGDSAGAWLHVQCWLAWSSHRNAEARSALAAMGLGSQGSS
jgi:hypothetical protein